MNLIIGGSGFVGQNYLKAFPSTVQVTRGQLENLNQKLACETLVVAAPSAEKWRANKSPQTDLDSVSWLAEKIRTFFEPTKVLLFSTVDVYGDQDGADEKTPPAPTTPYGENRLFFSNQMQESFENCTVIRLPGLYGPGLKKNLIYDILAGRERHLANVNPLSFFQWVDIRWAVRQAKEVVASAHPMQNLVAEPVQVLDLPIGGGWRDSLGESAPVVTYDVRTATSKTGYLLSKSECKHFLTSWIVNYDEV